MKIIGKLLKLAGKIFLTLLAFLFVCILLYFGKLKFEELQAHREIKEVQAEMKPSPQSICRRIFLFFLSERQPMAVKKCRS